MQITKGCDYAFIPSSCCEKDGWLSGASHWMRTIEHLKKNEDLWDIIDRILAVHMFLSNSVCQASCTRPTSTGIAPLSQAVKLVTYFLKHRPDAVPLTLQSAVKHYYPQVILLIPQKHPVVTGKSIQALDRTWYRMWYHTAVSISVTNHIPVNMSSPWLVSCALHFFIW